MSNHADNSHDAGDDKSQDIEPDTQSDPALDDGPSTDWSSEGGATAEGPATDSADGTPA